MNTNYHRKPVQFNPELEDLRAKALLENSLEKNEWIMHLIKRTSTIHAGFLFEDLKTLQDFCLFIVETQNKITDAGWEVFGYHLGLSPSLLKVIKHNNFTREDPCYNVLLAYVQNENASIGKIIEALYTMGRIDVLSRIKHAINGLADIVLNCNTNSNNNSVEDTSDYESLPALEGCSQSCDSNSSSLNHVFIRPKIIPPAPFLFQNIKVNPELTSQKIQQSFSYVTSSESFSNCTREGCESKQSMNKKIMCNNFIKNQDAQPLKEKLYTMNKSIFKPENSKLDKKKKYGLKVFLTFAEDGESYAQEIAKRFRQKVDNRPSIGVLILAEHADYVSMDSQQFIEGAFHQVDYVCPVITPGYYRLITKKEKPTSLPYNHIDASYAQYIYRLMNSYFISNNCLNDKVRCIIPENLFSSVPINFLLTNPIFGAWVNLSDIDDLIKNLLKSKEIKSNDL